LHFVDKKYADRLKDDEKQNLKTVYWSWKTKGKEVVICCGFCLIGGSMELL
jgi:hypothetical protein